MNFLKTKIQQDGRRRQVKLTHHYLPTTGPDPSLEASSVADPDPNPSDPYVFGPPGSVSGSFYHQAKIVKKALIPTVL
jgi:hypothetical protein